MTDCDEIRDGRDSRRAVTDSTADATDSAVDATDSTLESGERGRRDLLAAASGALSVALASAGCLSNPWGPSRPGSGAAGTTAADGTLSATDAADGTRTTTADPTAADDGDAADSTTDDGTGTEDSTTATDTATETATSTTPPEEKDPDQVVEVAPDGFRFEPETFTIDAGDTVHWQWKDAGHNVRVREKPADSDWTGTPGTASDTYGEGYLHAHTFDAAGEYECYCAPHQTLGLEGSFTVR